jgi:AraC family transcriptional regulator
MMNYATATIDLTNQQEAARVLPQAPLVDSYHTGWKGLTQILHLTGKVNQVGV